MEKANFGQIVSFLFGIANDCLVDTYDVGDYRKIILPMMVIRRFDAVLEPTKEKVLKMKEQLDAAGITDQDEALCSVAGEAFCNSSPYTLSDLKSRTNQQQLKSDFILYLNGFSQNVQDIIKRFEFRNQIDKLSEHDILGLLISKFTDSSVNLSNRPIYDAKGNLVQPALDNHTMGTVFEEVIRKFNEETNITDAGRHFTPRDIVELITDLAFVPVKGKIQSTTYRIYDGACGTGGMLTVAEGRMQEMAKEFGKNVSIHLYGQENSDETYAIARSDMLVKGEGVQANNIFFGSTISNDGFSGETFDFMLSNPPFGTPWKTDLKAWGDIKKDEITDTRFRVNYKGEDFSLIPDIGDPQMLFLANNISKMKKNTVLGSRIVEVHNSSSLSTGKAGSGPSNLRQYIIEQDMLEAIVALPEEMFYNTPITTYIWVLTNKKDVKRKGKVQLIDATKIKTSLRKNLGNKKFEISKELRSKILDIYMGFDQADSKLSKIVDNSDFGYWEVPIMHPLYDENGKIVVETKGKNKGKPKADKDLTDKNRVQFSYAGGVEAFYSEEVKPYSPDAWIDWDNMVKNASYFAFTATPKNKTLEMFGKKERLPDGTTKPEPHYVYTMKQAIEEGFIMDVLRHFTPVQSYYKLAKTIEDDPKFDKKRAQRLLRYYVESNQYAIHEKANIMVEHFHTEVIAKGKVGGKARAMVITSSIKRAIEYYKAVSKLLEERKSPFKAIVAFSGSVEYEGKHVTEADLNGFPSAKIEKTFKGDPYRILIVANKFQTGFDEPLLHTMYVDKGLADIKAVQTLSRLNRSHPDKKDTFILDFVNEPGVIKEAFDRYYKTTILSGETDVNKLNDLIDTMESIQVYSDADVDTFVERYLADEPRDRLDPILDHCVEVYEGLIIEDQIEFKSCAKTFVRTYNFLSAILPYGSVQWEKLSIFLNLLIPKLPKPEGEDYTEGLLEDVDLESYRAEAQQTMRIQLENENGEIDPIPVSTSVGVDVPELDTLTNILKEFHDIFGNIEWTDEDKIKKQINDIIESVRRDEKYNNAMQFSDKQNARDESDRAAHEAVMNSMCHDAGLYQIDLLNGSKTRVTEREYWAKKKGQLALDEENAVLAEQGLPVKQTKFETDKDKLREEIRMALSDAVSFEDFAEKLLRRGITVKESRGRLSYLTPDRTKPITARKLGDDFDKAAVFAIFVRNTKRVRAKTDPIPSAPAMQKIINERDTVSRMVDIDAAKEKGKGYEHWAKKHNLKNASRAYLLYKEMGFDSPEALATACDAAHEKLSDIRTEMKSVEATIAEKKELRNHVLNYHKTRYVIDEMKACKNEKARQKYRDEHDSDFIILNTAKCYFDSKGLKKLPSHKALQTEVEQLIKEKNELYNQYQTAKEEAQRLGTIRHNLEQTLGRKIEHKKEQER